MSSSSPGSDSKSLVGQLAAKRPERTIEAVIAELIPKGYWPARVARLYQEKEFSQVIALCKEHLVDDSQSCSGLLMYALALFRTGQLDSSEGQFQRVLAYDPDNLVALKYLGDIRYARNEPLAAWSHYQRVLEIDPHSHGLSCELADRPTTTTRTVAIKRGSEGEKPSVRPKLRKILFYTETMGDLYLSQGHNRLAAEVFGQLVETGENPRWIEKLNEARNKLTD